MVSFIDGPAAGKVLMLRRAPKFLRVVESHGQWDALDQLHDTPQPEETLHVYQLKGKVMNCHVKMRKGGGWFVMARYELCLEQADESSMRENAAWQAWCRGHVHLLAKQG